MNSLHKIETIANYWIKRHSEVDETLTNGHLFDLCYLSKGYFLAFRCTLLFDAIMSTYLDKEDSVCFLYPDLGDSRAGEVSKLYRAPDILDVDPPDWELDILNEIWCDSGNLHGDLLYSRDRPYALPSNWGPETDERGNFKESLMSNVQTALYFHEILFCQDHMDDVYEYEMRYQREASDAKKVNEKLKADIAVLRKKVEDQKALLDFTGFG